MEEKLQVHQYSCGVVIMLKRSVFPEIHSVYSPLVEFAGRAGAVRVVRRDVDLLIVTFYLPPDPSKKNNRECVVQVLEWVRKVCSKMPNTCTVVCACDANARMGEDHEGQGADSWVRKL